MTKPRILVSAPYFLPVIERFRPRLESHGLELIVPEVHERLSERELLPLVGDIAGTICGDDEYTENVLAAAPSLRVISKWGTGIDSIDQDACRRRNVTICRTPNAFTIPVADSTIGYILMHVRQLPQQADAMRQGAWGKTPLKSVAECTIGVVGVGNVGREVVRRLATFGPRLLGTDPRRPPEEFLQATGLQMVDYPTLLRESEIITLHCDLNPTSFRILNRDALARIRKGTFVVNTARGRLIEEPELIAALRSGHLSGVALDVFDHEPLPLDSPLRSMRQAVLASHNSNSSPRAWEHIHERTVVNLLQHLDGAS